MGIKANNLKQGNLKIGTSGFSYAHWKYSFYPEGMKSNQYLSYYSQQFPTVESNSSFYHIPRLSTIEKWQTQVPENFIFTFKAPRLITHLKKLNVDEKIIETALSPFLPFAKTPAQHLILFQVPANFKMNKEKLEHTLSLLADSFLYAFEFRSADWFSEEIYKVLKKYNVALVFSDSMIKKGGERTWPYHDIETANFSYIRFHGSKQMYRSSYTDEELNYYSKIIKNKISRGLDVYVYFNNDIDRHAVSNARKLMEILQ